MSKTSKIVWGIICVILVVGAIGYVGSRKKTVTNSSREVVKIGVVLPLTGGAADYGQTAQKAAELAAEKLNQQNDFDIKIIFEDSQFEPQKAADAAQKLVNIDGVKYVVGYSSPETLAMCPITNANKVVLLTTGSTPDISTKCAGYTFRNYPSDINQGKALAERLRDGGYQSAAVFYVNTDYGVGLEKEFVKDFQGKIVAMESHNLKDVDFRTQLSKIKATNPDVVVLISYTTEGALILRQKAELGLKQPFFASETMKDETLVSKVGGTVLKNFYAIFVSQYSGREAKDYKNFYKQKFGQDPGIFSDYVFDNVVTMANALKRCADKNDSVCVRSQITQLDFEGATGEIKFNENSEIVEKAYSLYKIENNAFVLAD